MLIHSILSPNNPEAIEAHALLELRKVIFRITYQKYVSSALSSICLQKSDGSLIFKNAIDSEKKKGNSELLPNLLIRYGCFAHLVGSMATISVSAIIILLFS